MSYEIVKSIAVSNGKIVVRSHSSNIFPSTYNTWSYNNDSREEFRFLLNDIDNGYLQILPSCYKWQYIMKVVDGIEDQEARLDKFIELAKSRQPAGPYRLVSKDGNWVRQRGRTYSLTYHKEDASIFGFYKANCLVWKFNIYGLKAVPS